jgi:hypothetical protein
MNDDFLKSIPTLELLQQRFEFIQNEILRENVAIYLRYIIFLLALTEERGMDSLAYTVYKDIIIFTASIVESVLEYTTKLYVTNGKAATDVFGIAKKYLVVGEIKHECDDLYKSRLCVVKISKLPKLETGDEISFNDINKAAKNAGVLDEKLFKMADELRDMRNKIHLQSLNKSSNDYFKKPDVEKAFKYAHDILLQAEKILK